MSRVQELLNEREQLEGELASGRFMLANINRTLIEDQKTLDTHHAARVEIASTIAVKETLLESINADLERLAREAET